MERLLVKLPPSEVEIVQSFSFFHYLVARFPEHKLDVIVNEGFEYLIKFLPFKITAHTLPNNKNDYFGIHHYAQNLHEVFNIDIFIDLEGNMKSSYLGINFKAKTRIGPKTTIGKVFYNNPLTFDFSEGNMEENSMKLLTEVYGDDIDSVKVIGMEPKDEVVLNFFKVKEVEPFLLIIVDQLTDNFQSFESLKNILEHLNDVKIVVWSRFEDVHLRKLEEDLKSEQLVFAIGMEVETLSLYFQHCRGVITEAYMWSLISSYYGIENVLLNSELKDISVYFKGATHIKAIESETFDQIRSILHL